MGILKDAANKAEIDLMDHVTAAKKTLSDAATALANLEKALIGVPAKIEQDIVELVPGAPTGGDV